MKAMIFDMDGTILDSMWLWRSLVHRTREKLQVPQDIFNGNVPADMGELQRALNSSGFPHSMDELRNIFMGILKEHYEEKLELKPYAREFLDRAKEEGYRLCVATATPNRLAEPCLRRLGVWNHFDFLVSATDQGMSKGDRAYWQLVLDQWKGDVAKEGAMVFEDALYCIEGAKKVPLKVIALEDPTAERDKEKIKALSDMYLKDFSQYPW